jgi:large subunit ribosomal protein L9
MEVILLEKIRNLGNIGDTVKVKGGFGRNYLIPYGKAVLSTKENQVKFAALREMLEKKAAEILNAAKERAALLEKLNIIIPVKTSEEGKLFGSVGSRDIIDAVAAKGVKIAKSEIRLPEGPIRQIGDYEIDLHLHTDVVVKLKVKISAEEGI